MMNFKRIGFLLLGLIVIFASLPVGRGAARWMDFRTQNFNTAPLAGDDAYLLQQDQVFQAPVDQGVLANDSDLEGDPLSAVLTQAPAAGSLLLNADGSFEYTPQLGFSGEDSFTYDASDGLVTSPAIVTLQVDAVDAPPGASDDSYGVNEDASLSEAAPGVLANDSDPDGDTLTAILDNGPAHGSLVLNSNGSFTYNPDPNYAGSDTFTYQSSDGRRTSGTATVAITVNPLNDPPAAAGDAYSVDEDGTLDVLAPGVLGNDPSDPDGPSALTAVLAAGPSHGALDLSSDGSFTYQPDPNFSGADSFTYRVSDGDDQSAAATVSITVNAKNDPPVANNNTYPADEDVTLTVPAPGVLGNDSDADGDSLTAVLAVGPAHGSLTLNANGSFTYVPASNYFGPDSFTYQASDGTQVSPAATVTITVDSENDRPVAVAESYIDLVAEDGQLYVSPPGVLANDTDVDDNSLTAQLVSGPANGTLDLNSNGSFSYEPDPNFNGSDSFTYRVSDGTLQSPSAAVTITVKPVNDPPVAKADAYTVAEDDSLSVGSPGVLANDTDLDGNALTVTLASGPSHGTLDLNSNGSFTYDPDPDYDGLDSFTYKASDGAVQTPAATVSITVTADNDQPLASGNSYQVEHPNVLNVPAPGVLVNDSDPDSPVLQAILVTGVVHGTLVFKTDGSFTYTPGASFNGSDQFTYYAWDGSKRSQTVTVNLSVEDSTAPLVQWVSPITPDAQDYPYYYLGTEAVVLQLQATDLNPIEKVVYYRYVEGAAPGQEYPLIAEVSAGPYDYALDTGILKPGWNQIYGFAVDEFGNESVTEFFFIYKSPLSFVFMPVVAR